MKHPITVLALYFFAVTFVACSDAKPKKLESSDMPGTGQQNSATSTAKNNSFHLNDLIQLGDHVIKVTEFIDNAPAPDEFTAPDPGNKFVLVEVLYENRTDGVIEYNPFDWKLIDNKDYHYEMDGNTVKEPELDAGSLPPGSKARGWISFQVPKTATSFKLQFEPDWLTNETVEVTL